jgi:hypothetical protein
MKRGTYKVKRSTKSIDPRTILNYFSQLGHIKQFTAKKAIEAAREELSTTHTTWEAQLSRESKKWPSISEEKLEDMVTKALTKKYRERDSPMFSAADLCGIKMYGQHTKFNKTYKSVKKGKSCSWLLSK